MTHFLYKNFLTDPLVYRLNEGFYARLYKEVTKEKPRSFFNVRFKNGEREQDGNPIFSALAHQRLVRIIQEEPTSEKPYITAWLDKATEEDLDELVIALELSAETKPVLKELLAKWMVEKVTVNEMKKFVQQVSVDIMLPSA